MGCIANIVQSLKLPDGNIKVLVEGLERARAVEWKEDKGFYRVVAKLLPKPDETGEEIEGAMSRVVSLFEQVREAVEQPPLRRDDRGRARRRRRQAGRHHRPPISRWGSRKSRTCSRSSSPSGGSVRIASLLEAEVDKLQVDRRIQSRCEEADGESAERVLPEREDEGHTEGAGPQGGQGQRARRVEEGRSRTARMPKEGRGEGGPGAEAARGHAPDVGRGDGLAQLPRLAHRGAVAQEVAREPRPEEGRGDPEHRPLRPGGRSRTAFSSSSPSALSSASRKSTILTFTGPPGGRQDVACEVHRARATKPQVRPPVGRRRGATRPRDPRAPPHLHRGVPRPDHPDDQEGRHHEPGVPARRGRQDVDGLPGRSIGGRSSRVLDPEQNHTFLDHYLDVEVRPVRTSCSCAPPTYCTPCPRPSATGWRCCSSPATPSSRRSRSRGRSSPRRR